MMNFKSIGQFQAWIWYQWEVVDIKKVSNCKYNILWQKIFLPTFLTIFKFMTKIDIFLQYVKIFQQLHPALRVLQAETRLTVYRLLAILPTRQTRTSARPRLSVTWGVGNSNFSKLWRSKSDFIADPESPPNEVYLVRRILQSYYLCFKFAPHLQKNDGKCLKLPVSLDVFCHYDESKTHFTILGIEMTSLKCSWCYISIK